MHYRVRAKQETSRRRRSGCAVKRLTFRAVLGSSVYVQWDTIGALRMRDSGLVHKYRLHRNDICTCPQAWAGQLAFSLPIEFTTENAFTEGLRRADLRIAMKREIQDPQIVNICWALEAEARAGGPSGQLFTGALTTAE
jgi:hypothetical protein